MANYNLAAIFGKNVDSNGVFVLMGVSMNNFSTPAFFALGLVIVETLFMWLYLPETLKKTDMGSQTKHLGESSGPIRLENLLKAPTKTRVRKRKGGSKGTESMPDALKELKSTNKEKSSRNWIFLSLLHFAFLFVFSGMVSGYITKEFTLTFLTFNRFQFTNIDQGKLFGFIGFSSTVIQGFYVRRTKFLPRHLVLQGMVSCILALIVLAPTSLTITGLYIGAFLLSFTSGTVVNSLTSIASTFGERDLGAMLGIYRSCGQLGRAFGPIVFCSVYWMYGSSFAYNYAACIMSIVTLFAGLGFSLTAVF